MLFSLSFTQRKMARVLQIGLFFAKSQTRKHLSDCYSAPLSPLVVRRSLWCTAGANRGLRIVRGCPKLPVLGVFAVQKSLRTQLPLGVSAPKSRDISIYGTGYYFRWFLRNKRGARVPNWPFFCKIFSQKNPKRMLSCTAVPRSGLAFSMMLFWRLFSFFFAKF